MSEQPTPVTELHQLCRADYAKGQSQRATADLAPTYGAAALAVLGQVAVPSELTVAIRVARKMLAAYGDTSTFGEFGYATAHGALSESLRILLRALDAEAPEPLYGGDVDQFISDAYDSLADSDFDDEPVVASGDAGATRCPAAHPEDPTPCGGPTVVTVLDTTNAGANGCAHHAARLLASLDHGRVYALPDAPEGSAIRVFKAADTIRPFPWVDGPRTRDGQLSRAETRARGEGQ